jgi:hypothetical protein
MLDVEAGSVVPAGQDDRHDQDDVLHGGRAGSQCEAAAGLLRGHA